MGKLLKIHWIFYCILIFIISRMIMLYQFELANNVMSHNHRDFFIAMCKYDCQWYLTIINEGYDVVPRVTPKLWKGLANFAFFPLYPLIVKSLVIITGISAVVIGVVLNQLIVLISMMVFYLYLKLFVKIV